MADYHSLLVDAIVRLPESTPETRRQLYLRTRQLLLTHLQDSRRLIPPVEIERQLAAFDYAFAEIEIELSIDAALKPSPPQPSRDIRGAREEPCLEPPTNQPPQQFADNEVGRPRSSDNAADELRAQNLRNSVKSIFLIVGFPFVLPFVVFCVAFCPLAVLGNLHAFPFARVASLATLAVTLGMTLFWLPIAYFINQWIIDRATGARLLAYSDDLRVWKLLEGLCARASMRMPALRVIETPELNAFASGLTEAAYSVTVTRGLMATLNEAELEGVLAHELTHILNRDVRLTVVAAILVGIVPIMESIFVRGFWYLMNGFAKLYEVIFTVLRVPGAVLLTKLAYGLCFIAGQCFAIVVGAAGRFCSLVLNFSLSRRREFMADAGAVAITNDADAMISALTKISGNSDIPAAFANVREMFFDNPRLTGLEGFFATHPTIQARIEALLPYARAGSEGETVGRFPATVRWGDTVADVIGAGVLLAALGTMTFLILTA